MADQIFSESLQSNLYENMSTEVFASCTHVAMNEGQGHWKCYQAVLISDVYNHEKLETIDS